MKITATTLRRDGQASIIVRRYSTIPVAIHPVEQAADMRQALWDRIPILRLFRKDRARQMAGLDTIVDGMYSPGIMAYMEIKSLEETK